MLLLTCCKTVAKVFICKYYTSPCISDLCTFHEMCGSNSRQLLWQSLNGALNVIAQKYLSMVRQPGNQSRMCYHKHIKGLMLVIPQVDIHIK